MLIKRRLTWHIVDSTSRGNLFTIGQRIASSIQAHAQPVDASERHAGRHTGSNMESRNYIMWRSPLYVSVQSLNPPISFHTAHVHGQIKENEDVFIEKKQPPSARENTFSILSVALPNMHKP